MREIMKLLESVGPEQMIVVDGDAELSLGEFVEMNHFSDEEISEMVASLAATREYRGGGGAMAEFIVRLS